MKEKPPYSGYVLAFEPLRTEKIIDKLIDRKEASESFSAIDWKFERREVIFLNLDPYEPNINGAVLMQRMRGSGGTGKLKMRLSDPVLFDEPIDADELHEVLDLGENISTAEDLLRIDPDAWTRLVDLVKKLRPEREKQLTNLFAKREEERRLLGHSDKITRLIEQRDAVGMALDIANLDRQSVLRSLNIDKIDDAKSVLDLLDNEPLQEQDLIRHDESVFKGLLDGEMRHATFSGRGGRAVRIHVYDKKPLETVVGIDLLIYQEIYQSFLLIQYKTMKQISSKRGTTWSYLVDPQIHTQIEAMDKVGNAIDEQAPVTEDIWDWRLDASPFFFKFCETTRPDSREDSLIRGITLGMEHLKKFLALPESEGGHGGKRVGYDNCPRYLSNTQFIELAREGWIGCDRKGLTFITKLLEENQRGGKISMLAFVDGKMPRDALHRGRKLK